MTIYKREITCPSDLVKLHHFKNQHFAPAFKKLAYFVPAFEKLAHIAGPSLAESADPRGVGAADEPQVGGCASIRFSDTVKEGPRIYSDKNKYFGFPIEILFRYCNKSYRKTWKMSMVLL